MIRKTTIFLTSVIIVICVIAPTSAQLINEQPIKENIAIYSGGKGKVAISISHEYNQSLNWSFAVHVIKWFTERNETITDSGSLSSSNILNKDYTFGFRSGIFIAELETDHVQLVCVGFVVCKRAIIFTSIVSPKPNS